MSKPVIRVSWLEAFRKYMEQSDYALYEISEQSVIDSISGTFQGNEYTRIGTAFHYCVEVEKPACERIDAGSRKFLYYGKEQTETVPCGRAFDIDGHNVCLDIAQIKTAIDYRNEHPQAFHEIRRFKDYGPAIVTGCADMIDGLQLRDIKTKYSTPSDADYLNSCQWQLYMELFGADTFHFDLFCFEGYKLEKHGYDVRGLPLTRHLPSITCYRYDGMEQRNANLLSDFLTWVDARGLNQYLSQQRINHNENIIQ